jgi:ArsR family transcriptional regulator
MIMDVSEVLKALADPNRLRILNLLQEHALCVCDLEAILELNQSNLSRHLSKLKQAGIVKARKQSLFTYYAREELSPPYGPVVDSLCEAIRVDPAWEADRARLRQRLRSRKNCCSTC